ncbi:MAG: amidohydrolase, partial [Tissierellia bacterium]|nr:amidohydrolase [Tissierellia bacterium]
MKDKNLLELTRSIEKDLINMRRDFHMHPELGMEEFRTSKIIGDFLENLGIKVQRNVANTGVVGILEGEMKGRTIALRADMDALPMDDLKNVPYISTIPGKMHACGHDAHTSMLLWSAMLLSKMKDKLRGKVIFIFQPAEETVGGAEPMIREGVLKNNNVDAIFGLHMAPDIDTGKIGVRYGTANASANTFEIEIIGKSTHGATPHL